MSYIGQSPSVKRVRYTPQSVDPSNPQEGDFFYSDGTPRTEGLWVYSNGSWISVVGERLASQSIAYKNYVQVRVASTSNRILASEVENGDTIDGVVLATGNLVLLKDQTTSSENGVYVVQASGAPVRDTSANTADELSYYVAIVNDGTANKNTAWFQNNSLTNLSDPQSWTNAPATRTFTVPANVEELMIEGCGGGGAGGGGGGGNAAGGGGGGGASAPLISRVLTVTPGENITVTIGRGGLRALGGTNAATGSTGGSGASTTIVGSFGTITLPGASGGLGGVVGSPGGAGGVGASTLATSLSGTVEPGDGGNGGNGNTTPASATSGANGQSSVYASGGAGASPARGGGGGGGAASTIAGGAGGMGINTANYVIATPTNANAGQEGLNYGAGGGGGGGSSQGVFTGATSGAGGHGFVKFTY